MITLGTNTSRNPTFLTWFHQDKLVKNALIDAIEPTIAFIFAFADSAKVA